MCDRWSEAIPYLLAGLVGAVLLMAIVRHRVVLERDTLREENRRLSLLLQIQQEQYGTLGARIEDLRKIRHDLRYYIVAMEAGRPVEERPEHLLRSVQALQDQLEQGVAGSLGDVSVVGAVACHYQTMAVSLGLRTDFCMDWGESEGDLAPDLCLLLGNLLENAIDAVLREPDGKGLIRLRGIQAPGWISVVVGNTFTGQLKVGTRASSKREGRQGIGLATVQRIVEKYGGRTEFSADGAYFKVSVFLVKPTPAERLRPTAVQGGDG